MRRRVGWIALGGLLIGGVVLWLSRLWWLPWLLGWAMNGLPVDRLRYEVASWKGRAITLYGVSFHKGAWRLTLDSLTLRLRWRPCLYLGKAALAHADTLSPASVSASALGVDPLLLFRKALYHLHRLDTLSAPAVYLSGDLLVSFLKGGDSIQLRLRYDSLDLVFRAREGKNHYALEVLPGFFRRGPGYWQWEEFHGHFRWQGDTLVLSGVGRGMSAFHPRLSAQPLFYDSIGGTLRLAYQAPQWYVDFVPQAVPLVLNLQAQGVGRDSFWVRVRIPPQPFSAYQQAIPRGFFSVLAKAHLEGISGLDIQLTYNPRLPDTLDLQVSWQTDRFRIVAWPPPSPLQLQRPFTYRPWGSNRTILLSPENPNYLTYHQIHPYVLLAILHSEDGGFFYHSGFNKELFLKAMLENWRCKCYRRGAGTITMQLVRNLLLSRQKTLARKIEEICLTALVERFRLLSKQRILELYLNMVEWGPNVYGLTEASQFYFAKSPHDLTLAEAIFLGILLPSPRRYHYFIDDSTHCAKKSLESVFHKIGYFVVKANFLPADSLTALSPSQVCLRGPARRIFLPLDSLGED